MANVTITFEYNKQVGTDKRERNKKLIHHRLSCHDCENCGFNLFAHKRTESLNLEGDSFDKVLLNIQVLKALDIS